MSALLSSVEPATWHTLGLGVATTFFALGTIASIAPHTSAQIFGLRKLTSAAAEDVPAAMSILGARDLSLAMAMFALGRSGLDREMGLVIINLVVIFVVDTYVVIKKKEWTSVWLFLIGAAVMMTIGFGLVGFFN